MIDAYLRELRTALHVRGRARRRFVSECREHLADLAAEVGEAQAAEAFGEPAEIAAAYDREVALRRGIVAAWWSAVGVAAVGLSTLVVINGADAGTATPTAWAVIFWLGAQVAAVCAGLALVQAFRARRRLASPAEGALLCRRAGAALMAAAAAMFAAGAALPGHASAALVLAGPGVTCVAAIAVARAWRLNRRLETETRVADRPAVEGPHVMPILGPIGLSLLAALAAFVRDRGEAGTSFDGSLAVAAIEAGLVLGSYVVLRRPLGLLRGPQGEYVAR